ncbi:MAG TPA: GlsB/YeaQ/YmgE family stress response membrane protein [Chloroflexia bacterium]|nr:GlsB/YeaQ/YmgE family stress response membrane protein [Chloroflexia bacterium]
MGIIGWLIIGGLAGWLASMFMGRGGYGIVGDIIVGIIGAFVGGFIMGLFNPDWSMNGNSWWITLPVAFIGAVIVIWLVRMFTKGRTTV